MITSQTAVLDIAAHYDELDAFYRGIWGIHVHHGYWITGKENSDEAVLNLTRLVAKHAGLEPGIRVCDIGCGYGASAKIFADDYGARVTGITISKIQFERAKESATGIDHLEFLHCDGLHNGLSPRSFDSVVAIESSEHMPDKPAFFLEANRLLRPGGRLVVAAWLTREQPRSWESNYLLEPICCEGRLSSMASAREYRAMIAAAGFHDLQFTDLTCRVKKTWTVCAFRFIKQLFTHSALRQRFFDANFKNRVFAKTVFRIWLAYRTGSMRYGLFSAQK
jgi:tocopherol O-methyltransferase